MAEEQEQTLENLLQEITGGESEDEGDAEASQPSLEEVEKQKRVACEECLHTLATYALELETGQRESITAADIRVAFASHEVEEIYEEAKIFFSPGTEENTDFDDAGEEDPDDPDSEAIGAGEASEAIGAGEASEEGDEEEDFEGDELAED